MMFVMLRKRDISIFPIRILIKKLLVLLCDLYALIHPFLLTIKQIFNNFESLITRDFRQFRIEFTAHRIFSSLSRTLTYDCLLFPSLLYYIFFFTMMLSRRFHLDMLKIVFIFSFQAKLYSHGITELTHQILLQLFSLLILSLLCYKC